MRSRGHQCGVIGRNFLTHTIRTHTHNCLCTQHYYCSRPLASAAPKSRHTLTLLCSCHFTRDSVSVYIRLSCMDDKISWLGGWACQWRPPLTYLLTYSKEQSPSWEANRFSASQEIPAFYGTRMFITAFTSARHLSLSWASSIQSIPPHPTSWRSILILSSHLRLGLPSGLFPSGFPTTTLYTPLLSPHTCYMPRQSRFDHPNNTGWAVQIIKLLIM